MATKRTPSKKTDPIQEQRSEQISQLEQVMSKLQKEKVNLRTKQKTRLKLLASTAKGQYEEMDKLSKKAPAEKVSDLALGEINYVIEETKEFLSKDVVVQRLNKFVPAGDNPELRDAVFVLRQILQGLDRYSVEIAPREEKIKAAIAEAEALKEVLEVFIERGVTVIKDDDNLSSKTKRNLDADWFYGGPISTFLYEKLNDIDIEEYFQERVES